MKQKHPAEGPISNKADSIFGVFTLGVVALVSLVAGFDTLGLSSPLELPISAQPLQRYSPVSTMHKQPRQGETGPVKQHCSYKVNAWTSTQGS